MVVASWETALGWHDARVAPHGPLPMMPGASVFHYGQAMFEGLKAFRQPNGSIAIFRPFVNAARFQRSARRLAMPEMPEEMFVEALETIVGVDHAWVPSGVGRSLYLRPFMIATESTLGVRPASRYLFAVIASPVDGFLLGRRRAHQGLALGGLRAGRPGRDGRREVLRQLRPPPWSPSARRRPRAATRWCGSTPRRVRTSRRWAR